ncbi:MAG: hypothetical protein WEC59_04830 [Salibacteraceae bacterium]
MKYIQGKDRFQAEISTHCMDDTIEGDNAVRVIDAFVFRFYYHFRLSGSTNPILCF